MIHVTQPGETAGEIAAFYGISEDRLRYDNALGGNQPVTGQALIVLLPETEHTVTPNDTLSTLSQRYGTSARRLLRNNPFIAANGLREGEKIIIRYREQPYIDALAIGYAYPFVNRTLLREVLPFLDSLYIFSYGFTPDGELIPADDSELIAAAREFGVDPVLVLTPYTGLDAFNSGLINSLVNNARAREAILNNLVRVMREKGYSGADFDFEYIDGANRDAYSSFVEQAADVLGADGFTLNVALAPKVRADQPGQLYEGIDYGAIGRFADSVLIMTYEWGYTYGPPMAVSPISNVERVVRYALSEIPAEKIYLGVSNYGYDWPLPFISGATKAETIGNEQAVDIARERFADIGYSVSSQAPTFGYTTASGAEHIVWFEDARSIERRLNLVSEYGLRGAGWWNIMRPFRQGWMQQGAMFF